MVSPQLVPDLIVVMWSVCPVLGELRIEMWPLVDIRAPSDLIRSDPTRQWDLMDGQGPLPHFWACQLQKCGITRKHQKPLTSTRNHGHYRQFYSEFELLRRHNYWHQLYWHHPLRYTFKDTTHFFDLYRGVVPPIDTKSLLTSSETIDIIAWL